MAAEKKEKAPVAEAKVSETVTVVIPEARVGEPEVQYVSVNGKSWTVNKGEPVEVPRAVAEVLMNAQEAMGKYKNYVKAKEYDPTK